MSFNFATHAKWCFDCRLNSGIKLIPFPFLKGTVKQNEKVLINDRLHVSKIS